MITVIHIDNHQLHIARFSGDKKPELLWSRQVEIKGASSTQESQVESQLLAELVEEQNLYKDEFILCVPHRACHFRYVDMGNLTAGQVRKTLKFQAEKLIPGVTAENMVADFTWLQKEGDKQEALVVAVQKKFLQEQMDILAGAEIIPRYIVPELSALYEVYQATGLINGERQLFVDFQDDAVAVVLTHQGHPVYNRFFLHNGSSSAQQLQGEIKRSLLWARNIDSFDTTVVASSQKDQVAEAVPSQLGGKVQEFNLEDLYTHSEDKPAVERVCLVGAALTYHQQSLPLDLAQEEFQSIEPLIRQRWLVVGALFFLFLGLSFALLRASKTTTEYETYYKKIGKEGQKWYKKIYPKRKSFPRVTYVRRIQKTIQRLSKGAGTPTTDRTPDFLRTLEYLSRKLMRRSQLKFSSISYDPPSLKLKGSTENKQFFVSLKDSLEKDPKTRIKWNLSKTQRNKKTIFSFNLRVDFVKDTRQ